jgi:hypothetical protein
MPDVMFGVKRNKKENSSEEERLWNYGDCRLSCRFSYDVLAGGV